MMPGGECRECQEAREQWWRTCGVLVEEVDVEKGRIREGAPPSRSRSTHPRTVPTASTAPPNHGPLARSLQLLVLAVVCCALGSDAQGMTGALWGCAPSAPSAASAAPAPLVNGAPVQQAAGESVPLRAGRQRSRVGSANCRRGGAQRADWRPAACANGRSQTPTALPTGSAGQAGGYFFSNSSAQPRASDRAERKACCRLSPAAGDACARLR